MQGVFAHQRTVYIATDRCRPLRVRGWWSPPLAAALPSACCAHGTPQRLAVTNSGVVMPIHSITVCIQTAAGCPQVRQAPLQLCRVWRMRPAPEGLDLDEVLAAEAVVPSQPAPGRLKQQHGRQPQQPETSQKAQQQEQERQVAVQAEGGQRPEWMQQHATAMLFLLKGGALAASVVGAGFLAKYLWEGRRAVERNASPAGIKPDTGAAAAATAAAAALPAALPAAAAAQPATAKRGEAAARLGSRPGEQLFRPAPPTILPPKPLAGLGPLSAQQLPEALVASLGDASPLLLPRPGTVPVEPPPPAGWWRSLESVHYVNFGSQHGVLPRLQLGAFAGPANAAAGGREVLVAFQDAGDAAYVAGTLRHGLMQALAAGACVCVGGGGGTSCVRAAPICQRTGVHWRCFVILPFSCRVCWRHCGASAAHPLPPPCSSAIPCVSLQISSTPCSVRSPQDACLLVLQLSWRTLHACRVPPWMCCLQDGWRTAAA